MDYEYTLIQKDRACLFNLPPMTNSKGHYLDTWKDMIWEGIVKVTAQNKSLKIYFMNLDKTVFAVSPVPQKYEEGIQKCVDSSRGFAVRLQHTSGKFAWVGLAFRDRNDAFDFNVCFSDFEKKLDRELNPQKYASEFENTKDFSLKPGEKISFNIAGETPTDTQAKPKITATVTSLKLAPPPGMKTATTQSLPQQQKPVASASDWGNFGSFNAPAQTQTVSPAQQVSTGFGTSGNAYVGADSWGQKAGWAGGAQTQQGSWDFNAAGFGAQAQQGAGLASQGFGGGSAPQGFGQGNPGFQQGFSGGAGSGAQQQQQQKKAVETNLIDLL